MIDGTMMDKIEIRDKIERWYVYRDYFMWDEFRELWHDDGVMIATWSESTFEEFITNVDTARKGPGLWGMHVLGSSDINVIGNRAIAMSKLIITERIKIDGVLVDMNNYARHYDFWEKREDRWGLVRRETICDKDTMYPVYAKDIPNFKLDQEILDRYPEEYQYLAYCIVYKGFQVSTDVPRFSGGPSLENLLNKGKKWLNFEIDSPNSK